MNTRKRIQRQSRSGKKIGYIAMSLIITLLFIWNSYSTFANSKISQTRKVTIQKHDTFITLGDKIEEFNSFWYSLYLRKHTPHYSLQAGTYQLTKGETLPQAFESLNKPIMISENITILEGWNIFDIDEKLVQMGLISKGDYIAYVTSPEKIEALREFFPFLRDIELESLEGYLYPETYTVNPKEFGINILVIAQLEAFEKKVYQTILKNNYSNTEIYELINLASIVEKEESIKENKPTVAGILKKRLDNNWRIGADATVCYPYKLTSQACKMVVSKYIYEKNEYNTRTKTGLPKTPIANPNYETIEATVHRANTKYWFYLHDITTGQIYYAETNGQHEVNKAKYIK